MKSPKEEPDYAHKTDVDDKPADLWIRRRFLDLFAMSEQNVEASAIRFFYNETTFARPMYAFIYYIAIAQPMHEVLDDNFYSSLSHVDVSDK